MEPIKDPYLKDTCDCVQFNNLFILSLPNTGSIHY